jgi:hypothetical protein
LDYDWSSYRFYAALAGRPEWFESAQVLGELGLEDMAAGRRRYAERMRTRAVEVALPERELVPGEQVSASGWCRNWKHSGSG